MEHVSKWDDLHAGQRLDLLDQLIVKGDDRSAVLII